MKKLFSRHEIQFILWFCTIFLASIVLLVLLGLVPSEFKVQGGETFEQKTRNAVREIIDGKPSDSTISSATGSNTSNPTGNTSTGTIKPNTVQVTGTSVSSTGSTINAEDPIRLVISSIGVDAIIVNPKNANHEVLDAELTKGAVRYPGSGYPGLGNMFIFGHSTGFSVVQNQAYKVFNKLKDVKSGDTITVYGKEGVYTYRVTGVKKVSKENALVSFDTKKNMITLSTCDSFGKRTDRYVVEGDLVSISKR